MSFNGWEAEQMKDPKFRAAWAKLQPEYWAARKQQMLAIPEVQVLVEAANAAHRLLVDQLVILLGSFPDAHVDDENDVIIKLRTALAPFEEGE